MPRSSNRSAEVAQRPSPRGLPQLRIPRNEGTKIAEGRSPRSAQSDPVNKKKLGTRISDLECQLGQAQDELKSLKVQLASVEAAKKVVLGQLENKPKKQQKVPDRAEAREKRSTQTRTRALVTKDSRRLEDTLLETDVFEVPMATESLPTDQSPSKQEAKNQSFDESVSENDAIRLLKNKLAEKCDELEVLREENKNLKKELDEKLLKMSSAQSEMAELTLEWNKVDQELESSRISSFRMNEKLEATQKLKGELENEMKALRVQTEQWKKAADAAALVLAGEAEISGGRRLSERCDSVNKNEFLNVDGYCMEEDLDVVDSGGVKKKGSGIRILGELWKKKGQK